MVTRQFPKPAEIFDLLKFKKPELNPRKRRLAKALTIDDLRVIAKRRTPKAAFDYTDGAAEGELSLQRARQAFEDVEFHPSILHDVSTVDTSTNSADWVPVTGSNSTGGTDTLPSLPLDPMIRPSRNASANWLRTGPSDRV